MLKKAILWIIFSGLVAAILFGGPAGEDRAASRRFFVGSSAFMLGNLFPDPPSFYQLNFGYRLTSKDAISLEAITWRNDAPNGIPYGSSFGDKSENYPGRIREWGIGVAYQRLLWKGLYSSVHVLPLKRTYLDEGGRNIQSGFRLFSTLRFGYRLSFFKNRLFLEPSVACTYWPIATNVPGAFAEKDAKWNNFFLFEPGFHLGYNF